MVVWGGRKGVGKSEGSGWTRVVQRRGEGRALGVGEGSVLLKTA